MRRRCCVASLGLTARTVTREERSFDGCHRHHRACARRHRADRVRAARPLPRGRRARVLVTPDHRRDPPPRPRAGTDPGRGRGDRSLPHRHPRRPRRLARQAVAAVRAGARGHRDRPRARARRDRGGARRPRRDAVARLCMRHVRLLRLGLGDALPRAEEHGLLDRRRLRRVRRRLRPLRRQGSRTASTRSTRPRSRAPASRRTRRSRSRAPARPTSSRYSASGGSATWRSSTRASRADGSSPST